MLREIPFTDFFTILIVFSLVIIAIAKTLYSKLFIGLSSILVDFKYLNSFSRDHKFFNAFEALLFTNCIIQSTLFCIQLYDSYFNQTRAPLSLLLKISAFLLLYLLSKLIFEKITGAILELEVIINNYLFHKLGYLNFIGLLLIPINLIYIYTVNPNHTTLIITSFLLALITILGRVFFFKNNLSIIKQNLFYFILYICALEIAPIILLFRLFTVD